MDVVLTTYGTVLRTPWMLERRWSLVALDEAQAIKNPDAKQTRAVKRLKSATRLALTGTPVENRTGDLWSLFDFLCPGAGRRSLERVRHRPRFTDALAPARGQGGGARPPKAKAKAASASKAR